MKTSFVIASLALCVFGRGYGGGRGFKDHGDRGYGGPSMRGRHGPAMGPPMHSPMGPHPMGPMDRSFGHQMDRDHHYDHHMGHHARHQEKHAKIIEACPEEAAACGMPREMPEEHDWMAMMQVKMCMHAKMEAGELSEGCLAVMEEMHEGRRGHGRHHGRGHHHGYHKEKHQEKHAKIIEACPEEAAACGMPSEMPEEHDWMAMMQVKMCMHAKMEAGEMSEGCLAVMEEMHDGHHGHGPRFDHHKERHAKEEKEAKKRSKKYAGMKHGGKKDRKSKSIAELVQACPIEAEVCGLSTVESDWTVIRAGLKCIKDAVGAGDATGKVDEVAATPTSTSTRQAGATQVLDTSCSAALKEMQAERGGKQRRQGRQGRRRWRRQG